MPRRPRVLTLSRRERGISRRYLAPGMEISRPDLLASGIGPSVLQEPNICHSRLGGTYTSAWTLRCFCGMIYPALLDSLYANSPSIYSCGCVEIPRLTRSVNRRPRSFRFLSQKFGRLTVTDWEEYEGWICTCDCGTMELVRRSVELAARGARACPHLPVLPHLDLEIDDLPTLPTPEADVPTGLPLLPSLTSVGALA